MRRYIVIILFVFLMPSSAQAQCENPHAEMGVLIMNKQHKVMQYCNGEKWIGLWGGRGGAALPSCNDGDITQFSGGEWACNDGSGLDNINASNLKSGTVPPARLGTGTASASTYLRGDGTWAAPLSAPPSCAGSDKALQWDGSAWSCATIEGGGATMDLVNGQHSSAQCTGIGGTVVTQGGVKMCGISGVTCPVGWARYQSWTVFAPKPCVGQDAGWGCATSCTTSARTWTNNANAPTCSYQAPGGSMPWICGAVTCSGTLTHIACY